MKGLPIDEKLEKKDAQIQVVPPRKRGVIARRIVITVFSLIVLYSTISSIWIRYSTRNHVPSTPAEDQKLTTKHHLTIEERANNILSQNPLIG
jgi:hypothetical protein